MTGALFVATVVDGLLLAAFSPLPLLVCATAAVAAAAAACCPLVLRISSDSWQGDAGTERNECRERESRCKCHK